MSRIELLQKAAQYPSKDDYALHLARQHTSETTIASASAFVNKALRLRGPLGILWTLGLVGLMYWLDPFIEDISIMVTILLFGYIAGPGSLLWWAYFEAYSVGVRLAPIANTEWCTTALKLLESGYSDPGAWRDQVLRERQELRVFDVQIMEALMAVQQKTEAQAARVANQARRAAEIAAACRKVHGIQG